jgi:hypothetical protein
LASNRDRAFSRMIRSAVFRDLPASSVDESGSRLTEFIHFA